MVNLHLLYLLAFFVFTSAEDFMQIYKSEDGFIRGIASKNLLFAFATKNFVIFGDIIESYPYFNEIAKRHLTNGLINDKILIKFKFINDYCIIACQEYECSVCCVTRDVFPISHCVLVSSFLVYEIDAIEAEGTLFLRMLHDFRNASTYTFKFLDDSFVLMAKAPDVVTSKDQYFSDVYVFGNSPYTYFTTLVTRKNIAESLLSKNLNTTDTIYLNGQIVITQIDNFDTSPDIVSKISLVLTCNASYPNDDIFKLSAEYDNGILYISASSSAGSTLCHFLIEDIEQEIKKTLDYCQKLEFMNCSTQKTFKELSDYGCLKFSWYSRVEDFPFCGKLETLYKCDDISSCNFTTEAEIGWAETVTGWIENVKPFSSNKVFSIKNRPQRMVANTFEEKAILLNDEVVAKVSFPISKNEIQQFEEKILLKFKNVNGRLIEPFHNGILYVSSDMPTKLFSKKFACNNTLCIEILITQPLRCTICTLSISSKFYKSAPPLCYSETNRTTVCSPVWYKHDHNSYITNDINIINHQCDDNCGIENASKQRIICQKVEFFSARDCLETLPTYLKSIFTVQNTMSVKHNDIPLLTSKTIPFISTSLYETVTPDFVKNKPQQNEINILVIILFVFILVISTSLIFYFWKLRSSVKDRSIEEFQPIANPAHIELGTNNIIQNENLEMVNLIRPETLTLDEGIIGSGFSSTVYRGTYFDGSETTIVAVKKYNYINSLEDCMKEVEILRSCVHENVVKYVGETQVDGLPGIMIEFMGGGNLRNFLQTSLNPLSLSNAFSYIFQALDAMIYLGEKRILHRDLAARNCLLDETYQILKVSDFGLSRLMNYRNEYISIQSPYLPYRMLPIESLTVDSEIRVFTVKGDVWSFGILVWEIFAKGETPYGERNLYEVENYLRSGERLERPRQCPALLYTIMLSCWDENPERRPLFDRLRVTLELITREGGYEQPLRNNAVTSA